MYGYIYLTTNLVNNKKYVGLHRGEFDPNYHGSGKLIRYALSKYGASNFKTEVLEECFSEKDLNQKERDWIKKYDAANREDFYNLSNGGEGFGGLSGDKNPATRPEVREKMRGPRPSISGKNNPNYGGLSEINLQHLRDSRKASGFAQGTKNPMYGKTGESSPHYGKIHVNNGVNFITIKESEFEIYKALGYDRTKNPGTSGKIYMNNQVNSILIDQDKVSYYESLGWSRGRKNLPIKRD